MDGGAGGSGEAFSAEFEGPEVVDGVVLEELPCSGG